MRRFKVNDIVRITNKDSYAYKTLGVIRYADTRRNLYYIKLTEYRTLDASREDFVLMDPKEYPELYI